MKFLLDLILVTMLLGNIQTPAQEFWEELNFPINNKIIALARSTDETIFAVVRKFQYYEDGLYKSTDNGNTWESMFLLGNVFSVNIAPNGDVWAGSFQGVYHSTNNGENWTNHSIQDSIYGFYNSIVFSGDKIFAGLSKGYIYLSVDNGITWSRLHNGLEDMIRFLAMVVDIYGNIFAATDSKIYRSTNNGNDWTQVTNGLSNETITDIKVQSRNNLFVTTSSNGVFRSTNSGNNWHHCNVGLHVLNLSKLIVNSLGVIFVGTDEGETEPNGIYFSTNKGNSWNLLSLGLDYKKVSSFGIGNDGIIFLGTYTDGSDDVKLYRSKNSSTLWKNQESHTINAINSVFFAEKFTGWVCGALGTILKTTDQGQHWVSKNSGVTSDLNSIFFTDKNNGVCAGNDGVIIKTIDGGETWESLPSGISTKFLSTYFVNSSTGWVVGEANTVIKTSDEGNSWIRQTGVSSNVIYNIYFLDSNNGWVVGDNGLVLKTLNGGETWFDPTNGILTQSLIHSVFFENENDGCIGLNYSNYSTSNGGIDWYYSSLGSKYDIRKLFFLSLEEKWGIGSFIDSFSNYNIILKYDDVDLDWALQLFYNPQNLNDIFFYDANSGWAVGNSGMIITAIQTYEIPNGLDIISQSEVNSYLLYQNYPNPFNSSTKISYTITQQSLVNLKLFDILGNELAILVSEEKPIGTYELDWDAANFPTGIYFYQLRVGDFVETRKMILLK